MNQKIINSITEVTCKLGQIAKDEGYDINEITQIWAALPLEDAKSLDFNILKEWFFQVSDMVEKQHTDLPAALKIAKKYHLMGNLLNTKAKLLRSVNVDIFQAKGRLYFKHRIKNS